MIDICFIKYSINWNIASDYIKSEYPINIVNSLNCFTVIWVVRVASSRTEGKINGKTCNINGVVGIFRYQLNRAFVRVSCEFYSVSVSISAVRAAVNHTTKTTTESMKSGIEFKLKLQRKIEAIVSFQPEWRAFRMRCMVRLISWLYNVDFKFKWLFDIRDPD